MGLSAAPTASAAAVAFPGTDGTPGAGRGGDIAQQGSGTFVLRNTILAATTAGTNAYDTSTGRITDGGYNISSDGSLNLTGTSLKNTDPKLGSLADNGGPTPTMALQPTSPAINKIPKASSPATDQRGIPRPQPQGGLSDIGAYELVTAAGNPRPTAEPDQYHQRHSVTFTVSAFGGTLGYQWRFNADDIADATDASYTIDSVGTADAGDYDVVITNSFGAVTSAVASLTVLEPPEITTAPSNQTAVVGNSVSFSVMATGTEPLMYQWTFQGTNLAGATAETLQLTNVQSSQAGSYAVIISNEGGEVTSTPATLTITLPPTFVLPHIAVQPDGSVQLTFAPDSTCKVQASTTLGEWQTLLTTNNVSAATPLLGFTDTNAAHLPKRFYRMRQTLAGHPAFTNFFATNQSVSLDCLAAAVLACQIDASTNLTSWVTLFTSNLPAAAPFQFRYTEATNSPTRFYRLSQTPGF